MIQTIFGRHIPPRRKKNRGKGITLRFVLDGRIPGKKNRQLATVNKNWLISEIIKCPPEEFTKAKMIELVKSIKPYIRPEPGFREWEAAAKEEIKAQALQWAKWLHAKGTEIRYPITEASIKIYHYWKDDLERDNGNRSETLHDIFTKTFGPSTDKNTIGVVSNDAWQNLTPTEQDADLYKDEILQHLTVINLTAYKW